MSPSLTSVSSRRMTRNGALILGTIVVLGAGLVGVRSELLNWRRATAARWSTISVGDDEAMVRSVLGPPRFEFSGPRTDSGYALEGYHRPRRGITKRVLVYLERDQILYVWIDDRGRVEEVLSGGS